MDAPLDEQYLVWIYSQLENPRLKNPARTYWCLLRQLYQKPFEWFVPNDDNRMADGRALRLVFLDAKEIDRPDPEWLRMECSMLELMVGLAHRLSFETDSEPRAWFWHLVEILDLRQFSDREYDSGVANYVDEVLETIIRRTYDPDGHGGFFPLRNPKEDQRKVELWYQLNAYLIELM